MSMAKNSDRGAVKTLNLKDAILLNGHKITKAIIEIDHINYGLNGRTKELNKKKRTNFSINDIEKFIRLLDGEDLCPERYEQTYSVFMHFIKCPLKGKFHGKEFVMIFKTDYHRGDEIHTVTLFPNW